MIHTIEVAIPEKEYAIHIEQGAISKLREVLDGAHGPRFSPSTRLVALCDTAVAAHYRETICNGFSSTASNIASPFKLFEFEATEAKKNYSTVESLYEILLQQRYERKDAILAIGGGVAGDLAGFVAASYLRGVDFVQVPTTLLSMVDASVGGKVGYNNTFGKNLIGAFHQPRQVIIDPTVLQTLPRSEFISGLAECVKHAILQDEALFSWTDSHAEAICDLDLDIVQELIARNVRYKARIVVDDEKEAGNRALLNFGHTFAHAIESATGYGTWLHGQAVALGMVAAASVSVRAGVAPSGLVSTIESILEKVSLPVRATLPPNEILIDKMKLDKKVKDGKLRLVLPRAIGNVEVFDSIDNSIVEEAWDYIRE